jgi:hypothetical protein
MVPPGWPTVAAGCSGTMAAVFVFAREVFVCKCPTDVPRTDPSAGEMARRMRFRTGVAADRDRLDPAQHMAEELDQVAARLAAGEHWMIGEVDGAIVTYTWLHRRDRAVYPWLPGCEVALRADTGYGHDAWTAPELRGQGLRRVAFLEELNILKDWGLAWEASFFVKHQLDGATRSLGGAGIAVVPLWRVWLGAGRRLEAEPLHEDAGAATPVFARGVPSGTLTSGER